MSSESKIDNGGMRSISPKKLSHAVFRTCHFKEMVEWYKIVLNAEIMNQNDFIAFMTYDDEHHRIAIATMPGMVERPKHSAGIDHLSFTYESLGDLIATYERLKALGITPHVSVNHGLTTSFYYRDPDGNGVELQIDNLEPSQWKDWMRHGMSKENPFGTTIDPEDIARKYHTGVPESEIKSTKITGTFDFETLRRLSE